MFSSNADALNIGNIRPLIPLQIDPPDHVRYRRLLDPLFAPKRMAALESHVVARASTALIDAFVDRGECDLVSEFTVPLPSEVFLALFGLPLEELDTFLRMKDGIIRPPQEASRRAGRRTRRATAEEMYAYFNKVLDERAAEPRDDIAERVPQAEIDGAPAHPRGDPRHLLPLHDRRPRHRHRVARLLLRLPRAAPRAPRPARRPTRRSIPNAVEELLRWETPVTGVAAGRRAGRRDRRRRPIRPATRS